ncbi:hypothetical protein G6M89_08075 [Natronolimnobius sp. AArcel1]|nr:hypothetical protein [Natronolimnobius sp. AArcel1]
MLAVFWFGFVAVAGASDSAGELSIQDDITATETAALTHEFADQALLVVGGGLLLGLGVGIVVASGVTYWYKNKEIGGRLG